jgi:hypothetical protein
VASRRRDSCNCVPTSRTSADNVMSVGRSTRQFYGQVAAVGIQFLP